jgi:ferredoxin
MDTPRSELYACLAEVLAGPPGWLSLPARDWPLFEAAQALSGVSAAARQAVDEMQTIAAEPAEARQARYTRIFDAPGLTSLILYESGALHGRLLSAETNAVEGWYRRFGLAVSGAELPDHASLELAFLSELASGGQPGPEADFLRQHAGRWLPALGRAIAATRDPVYAPVGRLLAGWVEETCARLGRPGTCPARKGRRSNAQARCPYLVEQEACTLCGFCVPACPANALSIREDDYQTSLFLQADRCSGCGKCARDCPTSALVLGQWPGEAGSPAEQKHLLRTSERARCRTCGEPLISQAELAYVADRLDHPDWLAYCFDCRSANLWTGLF